MRPSRRGFLLGGLSSSALFHIAPGAAAKGVAPPVEAVLGDVPPQSTAAGRRWISPPSCYFTYPHRNGFSPGSNHPVIGQRAGRNVTYLEWDFRAGRTRPIVSTSIHDTWWDISEEGRIFFVKDKRHIASYATQAEDARTEIHATLDEDLHDLLCVDRPGTRVLYGITTADTTTRDGFRTRLVELDLRSLTQDLVCNMPFVAGHPQYCPFDETWVGFSNSGNARKTLDRIWAVHRTNHSARPQPIWNQKNETGLFFAGHERWAFHKPGALIVAYPISPAHPDGLYFVDPQTRTAALISASSYDMHCNIDRHGRWAVVDTFPPKSKIREDDGRIISDIVLVDMKDGSRRWLARSHLDPHGHPYHPHPHFTPDGKFVIYNDFQHDGAGKASRVVVVELSV